jgi:transposase InsO family protein
MLFDCVTESPNVSGNDRSVTLPRDPVSKSRLEAENAALRAATRRLRAMGIRDKPIAPGSPWQNGFAERLIGSIRRECVDHIVVLGETHLRRVLKSYDRYL